MPRVVRSPAARHDLAEIVRYIARENESAARNWRRGISELFQKLAAHHEVGERCRTASGRELRRFCRRGYVVYFRPIDEGVEILRVFHGARNHEDLIE